MQHLRAWIVFLAGAVMVMVAVGGCEQPSPTPPASATPEPSPSSLPTMLPPNITPTPTEASPSALEWEDGGIVPGDRAIFLHYLPDERPQNAAVVKAIVVVTDNSLSFVNCARDRLDARNKLAVSLLQTAQVWAQNRNEPVHLYWGEMRKNMHLEPVKGDGGIRWVENHLRETSATPYPASGTSSWESLMEDLRGLLPQQEGVVEAVVLTDGWFADSTEAPHMDSGGDVRWVPILFPGCTPRSGEPKNATAKFWKKNLPQHHGILLESLLEPQKEEEEKWWEQFEALEGVRLVNTWQEAFRQIVRDGFFPGLKIDKQGSEAEQACSRMNVDGEAVPAGIVCNAVYKAQNKAGYGLPIGAGAISQMIVFSESVREHVPVKVYVGKEGQIESREEKSGEVFQESHEDYSACGARGQAYWWVPQSEALTASTRFFLQIDSPAEWVQQLRDSTWLPLFNKSKNVRWSLQGNVQFRWDVPEGHLTDKVATSNVYAPCYALVVRASRDQGKSWRTMVSWVLGKRGPLYRSVALLRENVLTIPMKALRDLLPWGENLLEVCVVDSTVGKTVICSPRFSIQRSCNDFMPWGDLSAHREGETGARVIRIKGWADLIQDMRSPQSAFPVGSEPRLLWMALGYPKDRYQKMPPPFSNQEKLSFRRTQDSTDFTCRREGVLPPGVALPEEEWWLPVLATLSISKLQTGGGDSDECVSNADAVWVGVQVQGPQTVGACNVFGKCVVDQGKCTSVMGQP